MTTRYETVGAVERATADAIAAGSEDLILVDDGADEILIAQPVTEDDDAE